MNDSIKLDTVFKMSFMSDLAKGICFLNVTVLKSHGNLKSSNCLIDARWTLKVRQTGVTLDSFPVWSPAHDFINSAGGFRLGLPILQMALQILLLSHFM